MSLDTPVYDALAGNEDHSRLLVAPRHQPEEQTGLLAIERQVADLVDDQLPTGHEHDPGHRQGRVENLRPLKKEISAAAFWVMTRHRAQSHHSRRR